MSRQEARQSADRDPKDVPVWQVRPGEAVDGTREDPRTPDADTVGEELSLLGHVLIEKAERALAALLKAALPALLSQALRPSVQRVAERAVREGISQAFAVAPEDAVTDELEREIESLSQDILAAVFAVAREPEFETHAQQAYSAILCKDRAAMQQEVAAALSQVLHEVVRVLKHHRKDVLGPAVRVLSSASAASVTGALEERVPDIASDSLEMVKEYAGTAETAITKHAQPGRDVTEEGGEPMDERDDEKGQDLRDQLAKADDTLRGQLSVATEELQQTLKQGLKSAAKDGARNQHLGQPPSKRHPSAGGSARRGPSGRPPSARRPSR